MKIVALFFAIGVSFFIGFQVSHFLRTPPSMSSTDDLVYQTKYENLKKQIVQIHATDFAEYQKLKEQKAKYEKADEILGKIFLIFLAEVGLKISAQERELLKPAKPSHASEPIIMAVDRVEPEKPNQRSPLAKKEEADWLKNEKVFPSLKAPKEIEDQLAATEIKDLFAVLKQSKTISADVAQKISGFYEGQISLESAPYSLLLEIDFEIVGVSAPTDFAVKYALRTSDLNKDSVSNSSGDGSPDVFLMTEQSQAIFVKIRTKGKENYMQLYFADNYRKLVGNYYESISLDQYKKAGTVALTKK